MPTQGGPSRRSHTKSRKGCKTCKRRHIRCDETFPQCRNCTKHQVRCDYMENASDTESQQSPEQGTVILTPGSENRIDAWQQSGTFPYPELNVFPQPPAQELSRNDLRLLHHLSSLCNDLQVKGSSNLTIWTQKMPKFLSIASTYPYVMQALLSFSANHLSWARDSKETRNLHIHHGAIALGGLHEAIGNFSHSNADAVLATSLLLLWQATDWRSWSSLRAGIQSVLTTMQSWKHESLFAEFVVEEDLVANAYRQHRRRPSVNLSERSTILQNAINALQRLQLTLVGQELETHWVNQLLTFLQTILGLDPPQGPEEQFNQLYHLRKWLFWVPVQLLQRQEGQGSAMLTLAHFYATALALEPLFPDLGSSFCAAMSLGPLESIITFTDAMRSETLMTSSAMEIASLMQWPQQTALIYRTRAMQPPPSMIPQDPIYNVGPETLSYTTVGNISPAFAPSSLHYGVQQPNSQSSSRPSSFLEVPSVYQGATTGFGYGTETWGAVPSPGLPAAVYSSSHEDAYGYMPLGGFQSGFVNSAPIWT